MSVKFKQDLFYTGNTIEDYFFTTAVTENKESPLSLGEGGRVLRKDALISREDRKSGVITGALRPTRMWEGRVTQEQLPTWM